MSTGPTEPSAGHRLVASFLHQMFVALQAEGFTKPEALIILGQTVQSIFNQDRPKE